MLRGLAFLTLLLCACAHDPEPVADPDYNGIRDRAHDSHQALKKQEGQPPPQQN